MIQEAQTEHATWVELSDYHSGALPVFAQARIEEHLADCEICAEAAVQVQALRAVWQTWTPEAHGQARLRLRIKDALTTIKSSDLRDQELNERLRHWNAKWQGLVHGIVRVFVDVKGAGSKLVVEGLDAFLCPVGPMASFGLTAPLAARGPSDPIVAESKGEYGAPSTQVVLDGNNLRVTVSSLAAGKQPPVVVLIPEGDEMLQSRRLKKDTRDSTIYVADFSAIPSGPYTLTFLWL